MNARAILHPIRWWRWLRRAAYMRDNDPACYRLAYEPKMCWIGRIALWLLNAKTGSETRSTAKGKPR